jgi:outer membrane PBP1 activator LpoA protein
MAENLHEAQLASLLPIIKRQNERTERMLSSKLHDMTENIHRNQLDTTRVSRQSARRILLVIALILTLVVAVILTSSNIYYMLMHQRDDLRLVERNLEKNLEKSRELYISESLKRKQYEQEQMLKLKNLTKVLEENKANSSKEINALKSNLKEQQEVFTVMVEKYNKLVEEQRTGTEDLLRKVFSKEQGAVVDKIDELIKQGVKDKAQENKENSKILELREKIFELKRKIGTMEQEKAKAAALPTSYLPDPRKPVIRNVAPPATKPEIIEVPTKK